MARTRRDEEPQTSFWSRVALMPPSGRRLPDTALDVLRSAQPGKGRPAGEYREPERREAVQEDGRYGDGVIHPGGDETRDDGSLQGAEAAGGGGCGGDGRAQEVDRTHAGQAQVTAESASGQVEAADVAERDHGGSTQQEREFAGTPHGVGHPTDRPAQQREQPLGDDPA